MIVAQSLLDKKKNKDVVNQNTYTFFGDRTTKQILSWKLYKFFS